MAAHDKTISKILSNFILIGIISFLSGKLVFNKTNDIHWVGFNYFFFTAIFVLITLLIFNNYLWFTISSILVILVAILFILFKINLESVIESANNINSDNGSIMGSMKANPRNFSFFFWIMFTITCVTVIGIIVARKVYYKMKMKDSKIGEIGKVGERGDIGNLSPILDSPNEICYQHLLNHANNEIKKIKIQRGIDFEEGITHLKNFDFKGNLKRISYSKNFTDEIFKLAKCKLQNESRSMLKKFYCNNKQKFMMIIINKIKSDLSQWIERISLYKKGLMFLDNELLIPNDWETLYLNVDKQAGLLKNPYEHFPDLSTEWGCGNKSNLTDCIGNNDSESQENSRDNSLHNNIDSKKNIGIKPKCGIDKKLSKLPHASKPQDQTLQIKGNQDGNYTWNWGQT